MSDGSGRRGDWDSARGRRTRKVADADADKIIEEDADGVFIPVTDVASYEDVIEENTIDQPGNDVVDDLNCNGVESVSGYSHSVGVHQREVADGPTLLTEDGKTWRKRAYHKDANFVVEYFSCAACEAVRGKHSDLMVPELSFRYCIATGERVLLTSIATREHFCEKSGDDGSARGSLDSLLKDVDQPGPSASKESSPRRWHPADKQLISAGASSAEQWVLRESDGKNAADAAEDVASSSREALQIAEVKDEDSLAEGPTPAATAHRRRLMKQKKLESMLRRERGESDFVDADESMFAVESKSKSKKGATPPEGFPFKTGLSSKGQEGTLIVITEDGKTWRRRNMRKKSRGAAVTEYFNCISCESLKKQFPNGKFPTLTFVYTPATDTRVLLTDPDSRSHICGRSTARTTAEQLVRKRKAVARLAGIRPIHAYESAACEAQDIGETEHWDNSFLSNVLEEIVTRTPKRPRSRLIQAVTSDGVSPSYADASSARDESVTSADREDAYPPEFPADLAEEIKALVASARAPASAGSWQLYTGDGIIVFVRR